MLIDTHAHLDMHDFDADRDAVIKRAEDAGVVAIVNPGIHLASSRAAIALADEHAIVWAAAGIHPHECRTFDEASIDALRALATGTKVVAIGEVGLDHYRDYAPHDLQESVFRAQIRLARELGKPLIVHSRAAEAKVLDILVEERARTVGGVLHCFAGTIEQARAARKLGFFIGVDGPVTYKNSAQLALAREFVVDSILLETDAPYLAPVPHRGKRNEPAFLRHVAEALAGQGPFTVADIERITSHGARQLFGLGRIDETRIASNRLPIAYPIRDSLYLNITNRCTLSCTFCPKTHGDLTVKGHSLRLDREPTVDEIMAAVGDPARWREVVFCGFGESTLRLEEMKEIARRLRAAGVERIRLDTDGLANFVYGRDVTPELAGLIDAMSVSLNAPDEATYRRICRPGKDGEALEGVKDFIRRAKTHVPEITASVVGMPNLDVERCRRIAEDELGVKFRVREYDVVG